MDLSTFNYKSASTSDILSAQKALRTAKCYNGDLDGDWGDHCKAGMLTWQKMQSTGGYIAKFVHRSPILVIPGDGDGGKTCIWWIGPAMIDSDGSGGNLEHDPFFQPRTSLRVDGKSLNARQVPFLVMTLGEMDEVSEKVLGSSARITNIETGDCTPGVVGDVGGEQDDGEISIFAATQVSVPCSPTTGGQRRPIIQYEVWPGLAAPGYELQAA